MSHILLQKSPVIQSQLRNDLPEFKTGCTVDVHYRIKEGNKERIQVFSGIVTKVHGGKSLDATFTVLKNATAGIKVKRTFPLHSPLISKVVVTSSLQRAKKAKLYYLENLKDPIKSVKVKKVKPLNNKVEA